MQSYYTHLGQTQVPCKADLISSSVQHQLSTDFKQGETQETEWFFFGHHTQLMSQAQNSLKRPKLRRTHKVVSLGMVEAACLSLKRIYTVHMFPQYLSTAELLFYPQQLPHFNIFPHLSLIFKMWKWDNKLHKAAKNYIERWGLSLFSNLLTFPSSTVLHWQVSWFSTSYKVHSPSTTRLY